MPQQEFALGIPEASHVRICWNFNQEMETDWDNIVVLLDQTVLGRIANRQELVAGRKFSLPDLSVLNVQLFGGELEVDRDGEPLPLLGGNVVRRSRPVFSPSSIPSTKMLLQWRLAYCAIFFIGGVNILMGFLLTQIQNQSDLYPSSNTPLVLGLLLGGVFLLLGIFVVRKSRAALDIAITLYAIDALIALVQLNRPGVAFHAILLAFMVTGERALRRIREMDERTRSSRV